MLCGINMHVGMHVITSMTIEMKISKYIWSHPVMHLRWSIVAKEDGGVWNREVRNRRTHCRATAHMSGRRPHKLQAYNSQQAYSPKL